MKEGKRKVGMKGDIDAEHKEDNKLIKCKYKDDKV